MSDRPEERFLEMTSTVIDMVADAILRAESGERVSFYFHAGDGDGDMKTVGYFNTAGAGLMLDKLCTDALHPHAFGACAHCDAVAMAIKDAQAAYRRVIEAAGHKHCGSVP